MRRLLLTDLDTLLYGLVDDGVPPGQSMYRMSHALEIGCGPGEWTLETARCYPHMQLHAIDPDAALISYARSQANLQRLTNTHFEVADWHDLHAIADESIDLVQVRFVLSLLDPTRWQHALSEWLRGCRSGGLLVWLEPGVFSTNGAAWNEWATLIVRALQQEHRLTEMTMTVIQTLHELSHQPVQHVTHLLELSAGTPNRPLLRLHYESLVCAFHHLLLHTHVLDAEHCTPLYHRMYNELFELSFRAQLQVVNVWVKL